MLHDRRKLNRKWTEGFSEEGEVEILAKRTLIAQTGKWHLVYFTLTG